MAELVSHPDEVRILTQRWGKGATRLETYLDMDGYKAVQKAPDRRAGPALGDRRRCNRRHRGRRAQGFHISARRVSLPARDHGKGGGRCLRARLPGKKHLRKWL